VEADSENAALDAAKERFGNGENADVPYGDARIVDTDIEEMEETIEKPHTPS
jgi:hypothetical protein